ncbi:MAG: carboxypeptidase-like regulatory domain-containing protein, partial [Dyadobacter sp.]
MVYRFYFTIAFLVNSLSASAGTLKGKLLEAATGHPALGVVVMIEGTSFQDVSGLDGSFSIANISEGNYKLVVRHLSYQTIIKDFEISKSGQLQLDIFLEPAADLMLNEVAVIGKKDNTTD